MLIFNSVVFTENNFVCDCRLKWMHSLRNETKSQNTKDSLEGVTCKMDTPIVSSAYNKIPEVIPNQDILYNGNAIDTFTKTNTTDKKMDEYKDALSDVGAKKGVKRNVLKIPPDTLPCPVETKKTTELPHFMVDPVIPIQNEMKFRFQEMNSSTKKAFALSLVLSSFCFVFVFT